MKLLLTIPYERLNLATQINMLKNKIELFTNFYMPNCNASSHYKQRKYFTNVVYRKQNHCQSIRKIWKILPFLSVQVKEQRNIKEKKKKNKSGNHSSFVFKFDL